MRDELVVVVGRCTGSLTSHEDTNEGDFAVSDMRGARRNR